MHLNFVFLLLKQGLIHSNYKELTKQCLLMALRQKKDKVSFILKM